MRGLRVDKVIETRIWKFARIVNAMFIRKLKKAISCFQIEVFFLVTFLCLSSVLSASLSVFLCFFYYFSFALLTVIGTAKRAHIIKASKISDIITMTS